MVQVFLADGGQSVLMTLGSRVSIYVPIRRFRVLSIQHRSLHGDPMPPRITESSYRLRVSNRIMVGNFEPTPPALQLHEPNVEPPSP